jgi:glyoxylase-like metal-dependent hydrolase (beta-lactamase superfamily II)
MTTRIDPAHGNDMQAHARASHRGQSPGFQRVRIGKLVITALYDGFVPVPADDLHGAPPAEIHRLLTEAFLPPEGDRRTAVNAFLVEENGRRILIDAGSGNSLGPDTGYLATNLAASQTDPAEVDHVVLTHLHPDHAGGLISPEGQLAFPRAAVHAAKADAGHWLNPDRATAATGMQRLVHDTLARALAPYREIGRFVTFGDADEVVPGVRTVHLAGHTPGHTGYLLGEGDATVLFWGDTVHSHSVQLRRPSVATAADSDEPAAIRSRRKAFDLASSNRWLVGAAHLPFPGLGHLRSDQDAYSWVPVTYTPVEAPSTGPDAAHDITPCSTRQSTIRRST